jgi:aerobic-type carbon monoxide dehydrogenase small subunit (CoxS/CutS family)
MIAFTLNGAPVRIDAPGFAPLSDTLRERLGLTGTKVGCEAGDCGACTILLDGQQACACLVPTAQAEGASVTTIEADDPLLARLRLAFLAHGAAQCGICSPGMIMAAAALLRRDPAPSRDAVADAIGGVLCRCTGYLNIIDAVMDAAPSLPAAPAAGEAVGASVTRLDGWAKVAGTDRFGADQAPADALWLRVVRSPHARARFTLGDLAAATQRLGLDRILSAADIPGRNAFGIMPNLKDQPALADGEVRFRGEAVLMLLGALTCPSPGTPCPPCTASPPQRRQARRCCTRMRRAMCWCADTSRPAMSRRAMRLARPARRAASAPPSSNTPISSPRPVTPCPWPTGSRSSPAPNPPIWTGRRRRASQACPRTPC